MVAQASVTVKYPELCGCTPGLLNTRHMRSIPATSVVPPAAPILDASCESMHSVLSSSSDCSDDSADDESVSHSVSSVHTSDGDEDDEISVCAEAVGLVIEM